MATEARIRANTKYARKTYDSIVIRVRKERGIKASAERKASARGMSLASYIAWLIESDNLSDVLVKPDATDNAD